MYPSCGRVDLVIIDVMMPRMTGPELAERLWEIAPAQRVLFMAGMPDTPEIRTNILDRGLPLLPKPFLPRVLVARVEEVLHAPAPRYTADTIGGWDGSGSSSSSSRRLTAPITTCSSPADV